jgi:hypothetical protein
MEPIIRHNQAAFRSIRVEPDLILFTQSLGVRFAVRVEEFFAALLPRGFEFRICDISVPGGISW